MTNSTAPKTLTVSFVSGSGKDRFTGVVTLTARKITLSQELDAFYPVSTRATSNTFKAFKTACRNAVKADAPIQMRYSNNINVVIDPM